MRSFSALLTAAIFLVAITSVGCASSRANQPFVEGDKPPEDAQFTLFCDVIRGEDHVAAARKLQEELTADTGLRTWHIVHNKDESILLCGYYHSYDSNGDPAEHDRARADRRKIVAMKDASGERRFPFVIFIPINRHDPDAPPEWNLANTPMSAAWSLQIAAYRSPDRKQRVVDAVRLARKMGVEAYYFHGETISSVCIGAWPNSAIKLQDRSTVESQHSTEIPVALADTIPPLADSKMHDSEGNEVTIFAQKLEVIDPTLAKAIHDYPDHAIDGEIVVWTSMHSQQFHSPSFLVRIPHSTEKPSDFSPLTVPGGVHGGSEYKALPSWREQMP